MSSSTITAEAPPLSRRRGLPRAYPHRWLRVLRNAALALIVLAGALCVLVSYQVHHEITTVAGGGDQAIREVIATNVAITQATSTLTATAASSAAVQALALNGPGNQYVDSYTSASKQLTLVALHNIAGPSAATDIPFAEGLVVTYDDQARQAITEYAEGNDTLGKTEIEYVSEVGVQGALTTLLQDEQLAGADDLNTWWLSSRFVWGLLLAPLGALLLVAAGTSYQLWRGYRRLFSVRLVGAIAATAALVVVAAQLNLRDGERAKAFMAPLFKAKLGSELPSAALGVGDAYTPLALGVGLALVVAALVAAYAAYRPRLDEYRVPAVTAARGRRPAGTLLALLLVLAACGCGSRAGNGSLTLLTAMSGTELKVFENVVAEFSRESGVSVDIETTRAESEELGADLEEGNPPDIADLPSAGAIIQYARAGELKPLSGVVDTADYGTPFAGLMRPLGGDNVYAVPIKVDVKSLVWYDPSMFSSSGLTPPASWARLLSIDSTIEADGGSPWCLALATPPTSGWPGADWIADILLSQDGPTVYQEWVQGKLPWNTGDVEQAWQTWGSMMVAGNAVYEGTDKALDIADGTVHPQPGKCYMQHGTLVDEGFSGDQYPSDYDFFALPAPGGSTASSPIQVSADFVGVFTSNPAARELVKYLSTAAAQEQFVTSPAVDGFSADNQVPLSAYPAGASRQIAHLLRQRELCFGAPDAMPQDLGADFYQAVLEYLAKPASLTTVLSELQAETETPAIASLSAALPGICGYPTPR